MITIDEIVKASSPSSTVLFLGAGACVSSGAPTAPQLARHIEESLFDGNSVASDLMEIAGIAEMKLGRDALVECVRHKLRELKPTGGLLALPTFDWSAIYTTNFDELIEKAFQTCEKALVRISSDFDCRDVPNQDTVPLYKIHGSLDQDLVDGHRARLVLTERDYDEYSNYRDAIFHRLRFDLATREVVFIGYSLSDRHMRDAVKRAAELQSRYGAQGRIFVLLYERDELRAELLEQQLGVQVAFGTLDDFFHRYGTVGSDLDSDRAESIEVHEDLLPVSLRPTTLTIEHASNLQASVQKLFSGSPATYSDIREGYTFQRYCESRVADTVAGDKLFLGLIGVAGVGKTTLARRVAFRLWRDRKLRCFEHAEGFSLDATAWLSVAQRPQSADTTAILVVNDCTRFQGQLNRLIDGLAAMENPPLRIIATAQQSLWEPRGKSPRLFSRGHIEPLSSLNDFDIDQLLRLVNQKTVIQDLIDKVFLARSYSSRSAFLRRRCGADMFVALKFLFASEDIDAILLREYAELHEEHRDVYRTVAALEASGTRVHRQLVVRLLGVKPDMLSALLTTLQGLVDEFDIYPPDGLYGWRTRHDVIAQVIAKYKFSDEGELIRLLKNVVSALNPFLPLERATYADLCTSEFGVRRIQDVDQRIVLYELMIEHAPTQRVPRHRLIRELLSQGRLPEAEAAIRDAVEVVGQDSPIRRYDVLLHVKRATLTEGLLEQDRVAILKEAWRRAMDAVSRFPEDRYAVQVLADVGEAQFEVAGKIDYLDAALELMRDACERLHDPQLLVFRSQWERKRMSMTERVETP